MAREGKHCQLVIDIVIYVMVVAERVLVKGFSVFSPFA